MKQKQYPIGIDGERWIYTNGQKTDTRSNIPLLPMAEEIITNLPIVRKE